MHGTRSLSARFVLHRSSVLRVAALTTARHLARLASGAAAMGAGETQEKKKPARFFVFFFFPRFRQTCEKRALQNGSPNDCVRHSFLRGPHTRAGRETHDRSEGIHLGPWTGGQGTPGLAGESTSTQFLARGSEQPQPAGPRK